MAEFTTVSAGTRAARKLTSDVLFCFPALRFDVFSAYRHGQYCSAPKPGKEKQKSYNYCSAVLMVHRFRSFLCVFTQVMRKSRREVTRKLAAQFEALPPLPRFGAGQGSLGAQEHGSQMHARYDSVHDLPQPDLG